MSAVWYQKKSLVSLVYVAFDINKTLHRKHKFNKFKYSCQVSHLSHSGCGNVHLGVANDEHSYKQETSENKLLNNEMSMR